MHSFTGYVFVVPYLATSLERAYTGQRQTTRYLASQMARVGPDEVSKCFELPIDNRAPTPQTFHQKERSYAQSNLLLDRADGEKHEQPVTAHR